MLTENLNGRRAHPGIFVAGEAVQIREQLAATRRPQRDGRSGSR
jgi:hypothetical protein